MKRITTIFLLALLPVVFVCYLWGVTLPTPPVVGPEGKYLYTETSRWVLLHALAAEDASAGYDQTATDMNWSAIMIDTATIEASEQLFDVYAAFGSGVNAVQIAFWSDKADIENDSFDFELYAYSNDLYGPAIPVYKTTGNACKTGTDLCSVHPTLGTSQVDGVNKAKWCDTISGTDCWPTGVTVKDSGNSRLCTITFDLMGCRYLILRTFNADGSGTECSKVGAIIRRY